jgi:hypothetical protein
MAAAPALAAADAGEAQGAIVPAEAARLVVVPENCWPDPQFCVQDSTRLVTALKDDLSGDLAPIKVSSYTTGSREVVCRTGDTEGLVVGSLVRFAPPADPALRVNSLRVASIEPNASFALTTEVAAGRPSRSAACMATIVCHGDVTGGAGGRVTSQVAKEPVPTAIWISDRPAHTRLLRGCKRVLVVRKATSGDAFVYIAAGPDRLGAVQGTMRSVGMAVCVFGGAGAVAQAFVNDGAVTAAGTVATSTARTWIGMSHVISPTARLCYAGVRLTGPAGSIFVLGEFTEAAGPGPLPDGAFSTPRAQFIRFLASISPWAGASLTTPDAEGFILDMQQTSDGMINSGVSILTGLLEGQSSVDRAVLTSRNNHHPPIIYNPIMQQVGVGRPGDPRFYGRVAGNFNLTAGIPQMYVYGDPSVEWKYLSFDFHGAILFAGP